MNKILRTIVSAVGAGLMLGASAFAAQQYSVTDLGVPFAGNSYALGINNRGQVVGYWLSPTGARAFLRDGARVVDLGTLGGTNDYALSVNTAGQVVGFSEWDWGTRAFLNDGGSLFPLDTLAGTNSYAYGINDLGHIVGYVESVDGASAFLYRNADNISYLSPISYAFGLNSRDQVVGSATADASQPLRAFRWDNGTVVDLTSMLPRRSGWVLTHARAINTSGAIVGWGLRRGRERAYLLENGRIRDLGVLRGGTNSYAFGLNNANQVVGSTTLRSGLQQAFLWRGGSLIRLSDVIGRDSGWELREARGINDYGSIVGWGVRGGDERAFLLSPVEKVSGQGNSGQSSNGGIVNVPIGEALLFAASGTTPATNSPLADAHVRDGTFTNVNFGTNIILELMKTNSTTANNREVYFKFGIDNAPSPLGQAILRIWARTSASGSVTTRVYSVTDTNWTETGIKWTNKPTLGTIQTNRSFSGTTLTSYDVDVTTYIRSEIAAGRGISTIALVSTNNTTLLVNISSKETNTTANRPILILNTNAFPTVSITNPVNNTTFPTPTNLVISATAADADGVVTNVDFYAGTFLIGRDSTSPFSYTWTNALVGTHGLKAVAYDDQGAVITSAVVNVVLTKNLQPLADVHVKSDSVTVNFGTSVQLEVQTNSATGPTRDTFFKFNLSGITNISNARIRVFASVSAAGTGSGTYFSVADTNWTETGITWSNMPVRSNVLGHIRPTSTTAAWITNDITSFVQGEKAAGREFISIVNHSQTNSAFFIRINSRETNANRPELVITTTNSAPAVAITVPTNNAPFAAPANISITATATDDDSVAQVEFFAGTTSLGVDTTPPYTVSWNGVAAGNYALTARATDNFGLIATSAVVNVVSDIAPSVTVTNPASGAAFPALSNVTLGASASDADGTVAKVEFFEGANKVGEDFTSPYSVSWNNVVPGTYSVTAKATDNLGISTVSSPVSVVVSTNLAVAVTAPVSGSAFGLPTNITVNAIGSAGVGRSVARIDFYANGLLLGSDVSNPYSVAWINAVPGTFAITATLTDDLGAQATSSAVYVTNTLSPTNISGLRLWLDAAVGITTNASGAITNWADQSGNTNDARQTTAANQPLWLASTLNSRPVVRFDGVNDSFSFLNNPLNALTQAEVFVVTKATADVPAANKSLWRLGGSGSGSLTYPATDGTISEDFGSTTLKSLRDPSQALNQYHLYNVGAKSGEWVARINSTVQLSVTNNTVSFWNPPTLGSGPGFYAGDIAEMLIFNRVLSAAERELAERYLVGKYALATAPAAPTGLTAKALSSSQISLVWDASSQNVGVKYLVERKVGASGAFAFVASVTDSSSHIDTDLLTSVEYVYRVRAASSGGDSGYSNEASATTLANAAAIPFGSLILWLKGDAGHGAGNISGWFDQSPRGNHATQLTSTNRPLVVDGAFGGRTVVRFDGAGDSLTLPSSFLTGVSQAEAFVVLKNDLDTPTANRAIWSLGGTGSGEPKYPAQNGGIVDNFGSVADRYLGDPSIPLDQYHVFNVVSRSNEWTARINGLVQFNTTNNTVAFWGGTLAIGVGMNTSYRFAGDMAELVIFNQTLTEDQRVAVSRYLGGKYSLAPVPAAPATLKATGVASNQISLNWSATITNYQVRYSIERKLEVGGSYSEVAVVDNGASYIDAAVVAGNRYYYRVKAMSWAGDSAYSGEANAVPPAGQSSIPLSEMTLWLKADAGHGAGQFNIWLDQSGKGSHGTQTTTSTNRPQAIEGLANGRPAVRFDGFGDQLVIPTNAIAKPQAEAFVLLRVDEDPPTASRGLWKIGNNGSGSLKYPGQDGKIIDSFATTVDRDLGNPAQSLTQFHLFNASSAPGSWIGRLNGATLLSTSVNTVGYWSDFALGVSVNSSYRMAGEIAEVIMFSRQLTPGELGAINLYLNDKYAFVNGQDASVALTARTLSSTQVALSWRQAGSSSASTYLVERGPSTNGPFASIGQVSGLMRYVDETAVPQTTYVYRVRNVFSAAMDPYSNLAQVQTPASSAGFPLASVAIWLRAEDIAVADGASVASWPDFWQTAQAATQTTPADQPTLATNGLNGRAAVAFSGGKYFQLPNVLSNASQGEVFIVLSSTTNSPAANQGLWQFNTNAASYYPAIGGGIQDAFGSTNSRSLVSPFADVRTGAVYNVAAATNLWRARLNGPVRQSLLTNTVAFNGTPLLGRSTQGASEPFAGRVAELIVFNRVLTLAEQKTVRDSLAQRYGITLELPQAPSGLSLIRTNGTDYHLSWTALTGSQNGLESYLVVERRADTNAPFVPLQALARTDAAYGDGSGLADIDYGFRLRMVNDVGETTSQTLTASLTDTDGDGVPDYLETILGTNPNNADTDGDGLPDGWELKYGLNPRSAAGRDGAAGDFDNDGVSNLDEYLQGGDPANGATGDNPSIRLRIHRPN